MCQILPDPSDGTICCLCSRCYSPAQYSVAYGSCHACVGQCVLAAAVLLSCFSPLKHQFHPLPSSLTSIPDYILPHPLLQLMHFCPVVLEFEPRISLCLLYSLLRYITLHSNLSLTGYVSFPIISQSLTSFVQTTVKLTITFNIQERKM